MKNLQVSRSRRCGRVKSVAIVANSQKPLAKKALPRLTSWLKRHQIAVKKAGPLSRVDTIFTLGGDGTILSVAPRAARAGTPVLGINTGRLGFMTGVELGRMFKALEGWLEGTWILTHRRMIEVTSKKLTSPRLALNEVTVRLGSTTRVTRIDAYIDGECVSCLIGDGVIVATPTGSTAYSLAARGPVVHPTVEALVLTPICPHSFTQRPVVFPAHQTLELRVRDRHGGQDVQMSLDGQRVFPLHSGDRIFVRSSAYKLKLLQDPRTSYFGVLREKLSWGER